MCGIIGALGNENICSKSLLDGLIQLQNRGYDSAGITTIDSYNIFITNKYASNNNISAIQLLSEKIQTHEKSCIGIAHTRWATHGSKTDINSHPHISMNNKFSLVHNGIIENFQEIKQMLLKNDYIFKSTTDSEVIVNLLSYEYDKLLYNVNVNDDNNNNNKNIILNALKNTLIQLQGTWGIAILCIDTPNIIYCTRHGSPLLVGQSNNLAMIVSEQSAFDTEITDFIVLKNNDICCLEVNNKNITISTNDNYILNKITDFERNKLIPDNYPHWTLKEIYEQIQSSTRAISLGGRLVSDEEVKLGGFEINEDELIKIDNLILLGCGTSYNAGMIGVHYFNDLCDFNIVQIIDGADFTEKNIPKVGKTALILLSQSGETKDLHRCIEIGRQHNLFLIGLVNVVDSLIAREVDCGCYLNAGKEIAVASTKSFTSQIIVLSIMAIWFAQKKQINLEKRRQYINDLWHLPSDIKNTIYDCHINIEQEIITNLFVFNNSSCFILGKGKSEAIAKEAALKIKELAYIHSEGYSTSSLKHGPFALLTNGFPVIMIAPNDEHYTKVENAYEEITSRYANILFITDNKNCNKKNTIIIPENKTFSSLLSIIPMQLLAYKLSVLKGNNPDMPKNLAKVVTVE